MNIQIQQTQCNSCKAVIPNAGTEGAVRLAGTQIDFCVTCSEKSVSQAASTFTLPASTPRTMPPNTAGQRMVQLASGAKAWIPKTAPLPVGAKEVSS